MLLATILLLKRSRFNTEPLEGLNVSPALNLRTRNPPRDTANQSAYQFVACRILLSENKLVLSFRPEETVQHEEGST